MSKISLFTLFCLLAVSTYGQQKKSAVNDTLQKKATIQKQQIKTQRDSAIQENKKKTAAVKQKISNQKTQLHKDTKEIYQTVFIARDTGLLQEEAIKVASELKNQKSKVKSAVQSVNPNQVKGSLEKKVGDQKNQLKKETADAKKNLKSVVQPISPPNMDSSTRRAASQQVAKTKDQLKVDKNKIKADVIQQPIDFNLNTDNNGTQTKSLTKDNLEQKLKSAKNFKVAPDQVGGLPEVPSGNQPLQSTKVPGVGGGEATAPATLDGEKLKSAGNTVIPESAGVEKLRNTVERVSNTDTKSTLEAASELTNVKTIFSQRQLAQFRDSLGSKKFDSIFNKASLLSKKKEVGKDDLLQALNQSFADKTKQPSIDQSSAVSEVGKEASGQADEITKGQLPKDVLEKLPPLSGNLIDSKYLPLIDSIRSKKLSDQRLKLQEKKLNDRATEAVFKKKPSFLDKTYFDGVIGVVGNENATIVQIAPALGYHFLPNVSIGVGPMLSLQRQGNIFNSTIGIRSFVKVELFKQRGYLQVEHQVRPYIVDTKNLTPERGNILVGGGVIKKLYNKLAINVSLMYRIDETQISGSSPWVFRLGISTIGSEKNK